jgi:sigma-B regulation protein RsbU (phosphoserine phosphatase)
MESPRILIADDQPHVLDALRLLLKSEGFVPEAVSSPAAVMQAVQDRHFDALLLDLNYARDTTSGGEGLKLLSCIRKLDSSLPVVLMTAWGTIELAVEAMQAGGQDFVQKPWDNDKLLASLRRQIEKGEVLRQKKREIEEAREIQYRLLPVDLPETSGCDVQVFWKPAMEVGGDYFDAISLSSSTAALCIGDVAGKGLPAALLMSNMQASVRGLAPGISSPAVMCRELNRLVLKNTRSERLTTFFYGILDSTHGLLRYCNAAIYRRFWFVKMAASSGCPRAESCSASLPTRTTRKGKPLLAQMIGWFCSPTELRKPRTLTATNLVMTESSNSCANTGNSRLLSFKENCFKLSIRLQPKDCAMTQHS